MLVWVQLRDCKSGISLCWINFSVVLYSLRTERHQKNSKNINLPVGSLSHSWCFCCFQLNSSPSECTYLTPTQTHNSSLTTQTGKTFKIMTESRTRPNTSESTTIMMLACLISLGHLEHMGTLKAGPGEFEKDLEGKVPMGAYWTVISCHVDECCYEN